MKDKKKESLFNIIRLVGDVLIIHLSFIIAFHLRFEEIMINNLRAYYQNMPFIIIFSLIIFSLYNLYSNQILKPVNDNLLAFIPACIIIILFSVTVSYFFQTYQFPRSIFLIALPILIFLLILWRYLLLIVQKKFTKNKNIILIGSKKNTNKLKTNIDKYTNNGFNIKKIILNTDFEKLDKKEKSQVIKEINPDIIFISFDLPIKDKKELFYLSLDSDWTISIIPEFYEIMVAGGKLNQIGELPFYNIISMSNNNYLFKRIFEVIFSMLTIIILFPLIILISLMIKIDSQGPVFHKQDRVSKNGQKFIIYKFRTMVKNAEKKSGPILSTKSDSRTTRFGRFLRKTKLDELPQFYNVLRGDISLIGPRPERSHFINKYNRNIKDYHYRQKVKSGLTGLAQIYGFYNTEPEDKLRMDLIYINNRNILFDLKIILNTLKTIFTGNKFK